MARSMYVSGLPTIKCSNCGDDLELSMVGDHICGAAARAVEQNPLPTNHERIEGPTFLAPKTFERPRSRSSRTPLNDSNARDPTRQGRPSSPNARSGLNRSLTADASASHNGLPPSALSVNVRPYSLARSSTDPAGSIGLSPGPPSRDGPPSASGSTAAPFRRKGVPANISFEASHASAHSAPPSPGGVNVLKRMNTLTHGPFASRRKDSQRLQARPGIKEKGISSESAVNSDRAAPARPPRPQIDDNLAEILQDTSIGGLPQQVVPRHPGLTISPPPLLAVDPSQDIVTSFKDDSQPDQNISVQDEEKTEVQQAVAEEGIKPLPDLTSLHSRSNPHPSHTSMSSESSLASGSGFGSRTESSRSSHSSPFPLTSPRDFHRKTMSVDQESQQSVPPVRNSIARQPPGDSTSREAAFGEPSPFVLNTSSLSTSPKLDRRPAPGDTLSAPVPVEMAHSPAPGPAMDTGLNELSKETKPKSGPRSKGNCRGCTKPIFGKSVRDQDGRISGRYHRDCFVCHTCKSNFETASFYALNDHPYCAHHYHVLNHSLCYTCNRGIEGKYLETAPRRRYHLDCFSCHDCLKPLTSDYYEINQRFYCEADALRVHEKGRLLSPGKRFPDRRTTRLMQM